MSNPARKRDGRCVICRSNNAMLIEWCIGVHRPHKSLLIWQSHSIAILPSRSRSPSSFFFLFSFPSPLFLSFLSLSFSLVSDPSTAPLHAGSCRSKGSENGRKTRALSMTAGECGRPRNCPSIFVSSRTRSRSPNGLFVSAYFTG